MPTDPLPGAIERDIAKVEAEELINLACPLLRELVNDGTNVLQRCNVMTAGGDMDVNVAALVLFRHILEVTDGTEVLLAQSCVTAAIPVVRSSFEAALQIEFILSGDETQYRQRALSWMVGHIHERLKVYEMVDPSTQRGREFERNMLKRYPDLPAKVATVSAAAAREATKLTSLLGKAHLQPVEAEYQQRRPKNWYGLFGGPGNLADLATAVNRRAEYDVLYRQFSRTAHGADLLRYIARSGSGKAEIRPLRASDGFATLASIAASCVLRSKRMLLGQFRPEENYSLWYVREVRDRYNRLFGREAAEP